MAFSFISDFLPQHLIRLLFPRFSTPAPTRTVGYHLRNIYILPTAAGWGLLLVVMLTLVAAINFQNSLVYALSFWLASMLVINILYTFRNLSGLTLELIGAESCFAGQNCRVSLRASAERPKESIHVGWKGVDRVLFSLLESMSTEIELTYPAPERGRLEVPRLELQTRYPTGLTKAWAYAKLDIEVLVYPAPEELTFDSRQGGHGEQAEDGRIIAGGVDDFYGVNAYRKGDDLRRIHWAKYASTGQLYSKQFVDYEHQELWLSWEELPVASVEQRLSHLCARVLELDALQQSYGLRIPGVSLSPGKGETHRLACLRALALFPVSI